MEFKDKVVSVRQQIGHVLNQLDELAWDMRMDGHAPADLKDVDNMINKIEEGLDWYDGLMGRHNI